MKIFLLKAIVIEVMIFSLSINLVEAKAQTCTNLTDQLALLNQPAKVANKQASSDESLQKKVNNWMDQSVLGFEENKGQFADEKGNPVPDLLFKTNASGIDMFVTTSGISYLFTKSTKVSAENSGEENKQGLEKMIKGVFCFCETL